MSKSKTADWQHKFEERGLLQTMQEAGVTPYIWNNKKSRPTAGVAYPLMDENGKPYILPDGRPAQRWKNLNSRSRFKNAWGYPDSEKGKAKPDGCDIYFPPQISIREAISAAEGAVHITSGEPDTWTLLATGITNTISFFGEQNIPADLPERLIQLGVTTVNYYPDLDKTGASVAKKLKKMLLGSGIHLDIHQLPQQVDNKPIKDLNDLFCAVKCQVDTFRQHLASLPVERLENPVTDAINELFRPQEIQQQTNHTFNDLPAGFYQAIEEKLGIKQYKSNGFSAALSCPCHEDKNPSAGWHRDKHFLKCFVCGNIKAIDVGAALGLDWRDYIDRATATKSRQLSNNGTEATENEAEVTFIPATDGGDKPKPPTDDELGDELMQKWDSNVAYFRETWHSYENGFWQPTTDVLKAIWDTMKSNKERGVQPNKSRATSIESYLQAQLRVADDQIDRGDDYLNLQNGLFNLNNGQLEPHRRDLYLTAQMGFAYDPDALCPNWQSFLDTVLVTPDGNTDPQLVAFLHEAIGYSLTTQTYRETAFWLYGEASSGKSTVLKVLQGLLGSGYSTVDFNTLEKNQYQLAKLPGKRVIACAEAKANARVADHILKPLISGEDIPARDIYKASFTFKPQAKLWWAMNEMPQNQDRSNAIYRRLRIIPFNNAIPRHKQDRHLAKKLLAELPGIFNLALEGLQRLNQQKDFTQVDQVEASLDTYREENDIEAEFLNDVEWCEQDSALLIQASDLYIAYKAWCERFGHSFKSSTKVARDWERLGLQKFKSGVIRYRGIGLTENAQRIVEHIRRQAGDHSG